VAICLKQGGHGLYGASEFLGCLREDDEDVAFRELICPRQTRLPLSFVGKEISRHKGQVIKPCTITVRDKLSVSYGSW
jgi:hypothetical protein